MPEPPEVSEIMDGSCPVSYTHLPRSGSTEEFMNSVAQIGPERIVYVSCNPETLVRDLKYFMKKGYRVSKGVGVDMFPFTEDVYKRQQ